MVQRSSAVMFECFQRPIAPSTSQQDLAAKRGAAAISGATSPYFGGGSPSSSGASSFAASRGLMVETRSQRGPVTPSARR
jgi:hypothetical protein